MSANKKYVIDTLWEISSEISTYVDIGSNGLTSASLATSSAGAAGTTGAIGVTVVAGVGADLGTTAEENKQLAHKSYEHALQWYEGPLILVAQPSHLCTSKINTLQKSRYSYVTLT